MADDAFDWGAAEAEMADFLADEQVALRPEVLQELVEAGWFDQSTPRWEGALCASHPDPDLWHPTAPGPGEKYALQQQAIAVCQPCPIRESCRQYGMANMKEGVWGGIALDPAKPPKPPITHCPRGHNDWAYRGRAGASGSQRRACLQCERDRTIRHRRKKEQRNAAA